jgi:hypothetical protein
LDGAALKAAWSFFMNRLKTSWANCARQAAIAATASLGLTVPLSAANAGFFDFLFAPPQPAQTVAPMYRPAPYFHYHHQPKRKVGSRHAKFADDRTHPSPARVVSSFMDDDSLKDGDVVMTSDGIRIFTGASGAHHSSADFAKISEFKHLSSQKRTALLALDAGSAGAGPSSALVAGRSVADSGLSAGEMIIDPRGNTIRYVGP